VLVASLVACAGEAPTEGEPCDGAGEPSVQLGQGNASFVPWIEGDTVPVEQSGNFGFWMTLRTEGLDTREPMTTFLRFAIGDETTTTDVGASVTYACLEDGTGNATVFATLGDDLQTSEAVAAIDGAALDLSATLTDTSGDTTSTALGLFLGAP
jgi:hypothetical protein